MDLIELESYVNELANIVNTMRECGADHGQEYQDVIAMHREAQLTYDIELSNLEFPDM